MARTRTAGRTAIIAPERIAPLILLVRRQRVMIDADLAGLYGVATKALNQAVRRNPERFPRDFMFRLTAIEMSEVASICDHLRGLKFSRTLPFAFTEHGAIMAANVLNSPRAVAASVYVVRAFVKLRGMLAANAQAARKLEELERRVDGHDHQIADLIAAIRELMAPPPEPKRKRIGFAAESEA
jgi:hypothetical protein